MTNETSGMVYYDAYKRVEARNRKLQAALMNISELQQTWPKWDFQDLWETAKETADTALND